ncbi:MAG: O-antigen ligase family protein [Synergistaceae bacterium]|nr:O-antigen ligase family protein [Synergistaceae bacterium]
MKPASPLPLVPPLLLAPLWFISLALPNLVYSGIYWYDTLHILKYFVAGVPVAVALIVAGARLFMYSRERITLRVDLFGMIWLGLLVYTMMQALWVPILSKPSFVQEMLCFSAVWAFYVISANSFPNRTIRPLLWLANVNAAINVVFAELQIRNLNGISSLILPTPGNYIGNTGQQNMFGLWMAICVMSSIYLYIAYATTPEGKKRHPVTTALNLVLMGINIWGLWNSTSRSAIFSLAGALVVLIFIILRQFGNQDLSGSGKRNPFLTGMNLLLIALDVRVLQQVHTRPESVNSALPGVLYAVLVLLVLALVFLLHRQLQSGYTRRLVHVIGLFIVVLTLGMAFSQARSVELIAKTADMIEHSETYGGRAGIWATSRSMFGMYPWTGVGIGQYKWHYLEAQREMFKTRSDISWQYTHWAHNEFLQWFCEGGIVGGSILMLMWALWGVSFLMMLWRKEHVAPEVIWACSLVALISFNAFWTRPFHRIENILWLSLGFAISFRDMFAVLTPVKAVDSGNLSRMCGGVFLLASLGGLFYLGDGMVGDRMIREALSTSNPTVQRSLLEKASGHLMVQNEALKNLGYHYMQMGEQTGDSRDFSRGFQLLWQHFQREPHSEELRVLIEWSQRFQSVRVLETLAGYLKPGTYRLETERVRDSAGNPVDAVVLVPLRESGGMKIVRPPEEEGEGEEGEGEVSGR